MKQYTFFYKESKYIYYLRSLSSLVRYSMTLVFLLVLLAAWYYLFLVPMQQLLTHKKVSRGGWSSLESHSKKTLKPAALRRNIQHKKRVLKNFKERSVLEYIFTRIKKHSLHLGSYNPLNNASGVRGHYLKVHGSYTDLIDFLEGLADPTGVASCTYFSIKQYNDNYLVALELAECV